MIVSDLTPVATVSEHNATLTFQDDPDTRLYAVSGALLIELIKQSASAEGLSLVVVRP